MLEAAPANDIESQSVKVSFVANDGQIPSVVMAIVNLCKHSLMMLKLVKVFMLLKMHW